MNESWVITGAGLVTAAGDTPQALFAALVAGVPRASLHADAGFPVVAIDAFDAKSYLQKKGLKDLSRISQLACAAASGNASGLSGVPVEDVGVVLGSAWGSLTTVVNFEREAFLQGARFVDPILFTETVANVPAGQVAIFFGWSAFNATVATGSASGLAGVLRGLEFLVEGRGKIAVAGGADELNLPLLRSLHARGQIASRLPSIPFSADATGPVGAEGACFVTIESERGANERGARPSARIVARAARFAAREARIEDFFLELLDRAHLAPQDVDLLVLPAAGRRESDADEARAVVSVFGEGSQAPHVIAPKGILGESWGASGALAVVIAVEAMRTGTVPGAPSFAVQADIRNAIVLDRTDAGHQIGVVLAAVKDQER